MQELHENDRQALLKLKEEIEMWERQIINDARLMEQRWPGLAITGIKVNRNIIEMGFSPNINELLSVQIFATLK